MSKESRRAARNAARPGSTRPDSSGPSGSARAGRRERVRRVEHRSAFERYRTVLIGSAVTIAAAIVIGLVVAGSTPASYTCSINGSRRRQRHLPQARPTGWATCRTAWEFNTTFRDRFATRSARPHGSALQRVPAWVRSSRASSGRTNSVGPPTGSTTSSTVLSLSSIEATVRARRLRARRHPQLLRHVPPARSANYRPAGCPGHRPVRPDEVAVCRTRLGSRPADGSVGSGAGTAVLRD